MRIAERWAMMAVLAGVLSVPYGAPAAIAETELAQADKPTAEQCKKIKDKAKNAACVKAAQAAQAAKAAVDKCKAIKDKAKNAACLAAANGGAQAKPKPSHDVLVLQRKIEGLKKRMAANRNKIATLKNQVAAMEKIDVRDAATLQKLQAEYASLGGK